MIIEHIFDSIRLILNKNRRGFVKNSQIVTAARLSINDLYNKELDLYRAEGIIPSKLRRFVKTASVTITDGVGDLPADFVKEIIFKSNCGSEGVFLQPEEFADRNSSVILAPDSENPVGTVKDGKIFIAPKDDPSIEFDYFRTPVDFVYATTVAGDGRSEVFNAGGSTDIEFDITVSPEIVRRALLYLGSGMQNQEALQLGAAQ